jgi:hypothetical protein
LRLQDEAKQLMGIANPVPDAVPPDTPQGS